MPSSLWFLSMTCWSAGVDYAVLLVMSYVTWITPFSNPNNTLRLRLNSLMLRLRLCLFFFFFLRVLEDCGYCLLNSSGKCWLFNHKQCICALFTDPKIPLLSNFFIKNGSHGTIYTFKNYFVTVFSVFSFSKISSIQTDPKYCTWCNSS